MNSNRSTSKGGFFNVINPGLILVLWDVLFGLPIAYTLTHLNKRIFQHLGYEKFMRSPGGARLSQSIFVLVNTWLVVGWAWQLTQAARAEREQNVRRIKIEIKYWDEEIDRLKGLLEERQIVEQLKGRPRAESEGGEGKKMEIVDGEIKWVKNSERKFVTPRDFKRGGSLVDWKKG